eukprot:4155858-Pleurochrysis_carterae.AAC.1
MVITIIVLSRVITLHSKRVLPGVLVTSGLLCLPMARYAFQQNFVAIVSSPRQRHPAPRRFTARHTLVDHGVVAPNF